MNEKQLEGETLTHTPQMSLRDHFAGLALAALISKKPMVQNGSLDGFGEPKTQAHLNATYETLAHSAYLYADAMLEVRTEVRT